MKGAASLVSSFKKKLADTIASIQEDIGAKHARIAALRTQLATARSAPVPIDEIRGRVGPVVAEIGQRWLQQYGAAFLNGSYPHEGSGLCDWNRRGSVRLPNMSDGFGWLCAADPDRAAEYLLALVRQVPCEPGVSSTERPAVIERLTDALAALEAEEQQMIDSAAAAGVVIAHRPEVQERQEGEARRRQLKEQAVADRRARQDAINAAHAARRPFGQSAYLRESDAQQPFADR